MLQNEIIYEKVSQIITSAEKDFIEVVSTEDSAQAPLLYNQRDLVRRINFYINDRYLERDNDAIFWNISTPRIPHFSKLLQFDTKDFLPIGEGDYSFVQAWALRVKTRQWFDDNEFYQTLNDLAQGIATYGGAVWKVGKKKGKKTIEECKLENLYFDQTVNDIAEANIVEKHFLTRNQAMAKRGVWENTEDLLEKCKDEHIEIWEYTGFLIEEGEPVYKHVIGYGYGDDYIELWSEDITQEKCPYEGFRLGRYNGRFLSIGVVERLFKLQERANELVNQNAETTKIASLLLFKSANMDLTGNVLEQAINGQIVTDETFQQVGVQNTGIALFIQELQLINQQADKLCMTPEIIQGEQAPSGTTFRGLAVMNAAAENAFTIYRQNIGERIGGVLTKWIFPDVIRQWNKETIFEISEDDSDIELYDKALKNDMAKANLLKGIPPTEEMFKQIEEQIGEQIKQVGRKIKHDKDFFNFPFRFRLMPTTETGNKMAMNDAYYNALQMSGANPALIDIPLFRQYLENNGISWWKLTPKQKEALQQNAQQGGSLPEQKKPDQLLAQAKPLE